MLFLDEVAHNLVSVDLMFDIADNVLQTFALIPLGLSNGYNLVVLLWPRLL